MLTFRSGYQKVLNFSNAISIAAIQAVGPKTYNKFIVQSDTSLLAYPLDLLAKVALGEVEQKTLSMSVEKVSTHEASVLFFRQVYIAQRMLSERLPCRGRIIFADLLSY